ncbi:TlpA family protein disulfide reductase [Parapedobacter deserti]|uniref:TlpA family protein disulfide reductase n=1 Tax=Parapedobacter deserti TaxID=1912957 RepID=A0ABV7JDQ3_9SPHI
MKTKILSLLLACTVAGSLTLYAQRKQSDHQQMVIEGHVAFLNPPVLEKYNQVWLYQGSGKARKLIDSAQVNADGSFRLHASAVSPCLYQLDILKWQTATFWSDCDVYIDARGYDTARVKTKNSGFVDVKSTSASTRLINTALYNQYLAAQEISVLADEVFAARRNAGKDSTWLHYVQRHGLVKKKEEFERLRLKKMIAEHIADPASVYLLSLLPTDAENEFFSTMIGVLATEYPDLAEVQQLRKEYADQSAIRNALKPGSKAPAFTYNDPQGNPVALDSFSGKYVLIDFWASWCGPCRKAIPAISELYDAYKNNGFDVLSVSIDTDEQAWRRAMAEEGMPWPQVLSVDKEETMRNFMIIGIPTLYLIDPEGRIIEKYTGYSTKINSRLSEIFGNGA